MKYDIAAYIWPAYTGDEPRTRMFWREGIGEWQSVKNAKENSVAKPDWYNTWKDRQPIWGYQNEADPEVMEMQIDCAVSHGVNVFIYDWYWFDNRPFLENCLNDGFLKAKNVDKMQFYIMWANHNVNHVWNIDLSDDFGQTLIWGGGVSMDIFKTLVERWISKYMTHPSYYKIGGCPVFMIYDLKNFVNGLGGVDKAREAVAYFREQVKRAGFPDLHLQLTAWSMKAANYSGVDGGSKTNVEEAFELFDFDSASHYQWVHFLDPKKDYEEILRLVKDEYEKMDALKGVTYFPHVSIGWDNNPRFKKYRTDVMNGNTPGAFERALRQAKEYVDTHELPAPLITVNSWNEWTETSYLIPDEMYGYGYLEAIKRVFVDEE